MALVLELDKQPASFVRQLEEQRKLENDLLAEWVRGTRKVKRIDFEQSNESARQKRKGIPGLPSHAASMRVAHHQSVAVPIVGAEL